MELNNEFMGMFLVNEKYSEIVKKEDLVRVTMGKEYLYYSYYYISRYYNILSDNEKLLSDCKMTVGGKVLNHLIMGIIKKWADEKGYSIHSDFSGNAIVNINKYEYFCDREFNKETEFEAVYQAGLWVFEKLKEQNND